MSHVTSHMRFDFSVQPTLKDSFRLELDSFAVELAETWELFFAKKRTGFRALQEQTQAMVKRLAAGQYRLQPIQQFTVKSSRGLGGRPASRYEADDAVLLKALSLRLSRFLEPHLSSRCTHIKGRGGYQAAARGIDAALQSGQYRYVCRSDAKGYYDAIDPCILLSQLRQFTDCEHTLGLVEQYLYRCVSRKGIYRRVDDGIPLGCPLSPLFAALYLDPLDRAMEALSGKGIFYIRYMDDWVILASNRYKLRTAVRAMNQVLSALKLQQHPDKTFIGKCSRSFDAFGVQFGLAGAVIGPSRQTVSRLVDNIVERYARHESGAALRGYVNRWFGSQLWVEHSASPVNTKNKTDEHPKNRAVCPKKNHTSSPAARLY